MSVRAKVSASLVIGVLVAGVAAGCATKPKMIGSGDIVADRQRLMKLNGASWADVQAKAKAGQIEAIAVNAETMALNSMHIPSMFPAGSLTDKSKAKPEVWQKWAEFEAAAKTMEMEASKLREAAKAKNADLTQAIVKDFGKNACGTCHTPFRVPPPRS